MAIDTSITIRLRDQFTKSLGRMRKGLDGLKKGFEEARGSFEMSGHLSLAADNMERLSQKARGLVEDPIRAAVQLEEQLDELGSVAGASAEEMEQLRDFTQQFDQVDPHRVADALTEMARDGRDAKTSMEQFQDILDVATASRNTNRLGEVSDRLGNITNAFDIDNMQKAGDVMTKTFNSVATNFDELAEAMVEAGPAARSTGQDFETTNALLAAFAEGGIKGARAGTALRQVLVKMMPQSKRAQQAWKRLGVEVTDGEGNFRDSVAVLEDMSKALNDMSSGKRTDFIKRMFGEEAFTAINATLQFAETGQLRDFRESLKDVDGEAGRVAETMRDNTAGELREAQAQWKKLQIQIGTELLPVLRDLLQDLKPAIDDIAEWVSENRDLVRTFGSVLIKTAAVTGAFSPLLRVMSGTAATVGVLRGAIGGLKGAAGGAAGGSKGLAGAIAPLLSKSVGFPALGAATIAAISAMKAMKELEELSEKERKKELQEKILGRQFEEALREGDSRGAAEAQAALARLRGDEEKARQIEDEAGITREKAQKEAQEQFESTPFFQAAQKGDSSLLGEVSKEQQEARTREEALKKLADAVINGIKLDPKDLQQLKERANIGVNTRIMVDAEGNVRAESTSVDEGPDVDAGPAVPGAF